jgi:hypothetical protein
MRYKEESLLQESGGEAYRENNTHFQATKKALLPLESKLVLGQTSLYYELLYTYIL